MIVSKIKVKGTVSRAPAFCSRKGQRGSAHAGICARTRRGPEEPSPWRGVRLFVYAPLRALRVLNPVQVLLIQNTSQNLERERKIKKCIKPPRCVDTVGSVGVRWGVSQPDAGTGVGSQLTGAETGTE